MVEEFQAYYQLGFLHMKKLKFDVYLISLARMYKNRIRI
jgi:hypothetical protein